LKSIVIILLSFIGLNAFAEKIELKNLGIEKTPLKSQEGKFDSTRNWASKVDSIGNVNSTSEVDSIGNANWTSKEQKNATGNWATKGQ